MCRWLAYSGSPIYLETLLFEPQHSLIDQSLSARSGETTNGDGFGVGWYGSREIPGLFKEVRPAWNDPNLRDLATQIQSPLFVAHVRAATVGLGIQRSNCHPFRWQRWLLVHNGSIRGFPRLRRRLLLAIREDLFPCIEGTTDSELMFFLALSYGLEDDPVAAVERMAGAIEELGREAGVEHPLQMTLGITNGESIWAFRYSSERDSRSLYYSRAVDALEEINPAAPRFSRDARAVVSEPFTDLSDGWVEIPESSVLVVSGERVQAEPFRPRPPG